MTSEVRKQGERQKERKKGETFLLLPISGLDPVNICRRRFRLWRNSLPDVVGSLLPACSSFLQTTNVVQ